MTDLKLNLWWEARDPLQADDARRLSHFVSGLPDFDPIYRSWLKSPKTKQETVPVPLSEAVAKQLLIDNVGRYDAPRRDAPRQPWPELGSFIWGGHAGPPPYDFRKLSYADTLCSIGAFGPRARVHPNDIVMRLSNERPSTGRPWRASKLRPLMKFAREVWDPAEMCAMFSFYNPPKSPTRLGPPGNDSSDPGSAGSPTCRLTSPRERNIPLTSTSKPSQTAPRWSLCARSLSPRPTPKAWRGCTRSRPRCARSRAERRWRGDRGREGRDNKQTLTILWTRCPKSREMLARQPRQLRPPPAPRFIERLAAILRDKAVNSRMRRRRTACGGDPFARRSRRANGSSLTSLPSHAPAPPSNQ